MKKIIAATFLAAVLVAPSADADPPLETSFTFQLGIGDTLTNLSAPTPPGKVIVLPAAFLNWECQITSKFRSNDGKSVYHNIVCENTSTGMILGTSVSCRLGVPDYSFRTFFLRQVGADVSFFGSCATRNTSAPTPSNNKVI